MLFNLNVFVVVARPGVLIESPTSPAAGAAGQGAEEICGTHTELALSSPGFLFGWSHVGVLDRRHLLAGNAACLSLKHIALLNRMG